MATKCQPKQRHGIDPKRRFAPFQSLSAEREGDVPVFGQLGNPRLGLQRGPHDDADGRAQHDHLPGEEDEVRQELGWPAVAASNAARPIAACPRNALARNP